MKIWGKILLTFQFTEIHRVGNRLLMVEGSAEPGFMNRNRGDEQ